MSAIAAALCAAGLLAGVVVTALVYERELRRMAKFLRTRDRQSNQRMTTETPGSGFSSLAKAVNEELDEMKSERIASLQRRSDFQRDLASLSHDIRTPLTGAKGFLQLAQDELARMPEGTVGAEGGAGGTTATAAAADANANAAQSLSLACRYLESAGMRLDDMSALLDQLFAYTRASDPDATLETQRIAILPVLADVLVGHYPTFEQRGWEPAARFKDEGITAEANEEALARIFDNLVNNALRYGTSPLSVTQHERAITFSNRVDPGTSIDTDRLFDRFYRADAARGTRGTGLGLAVAAKLAEAMGMSLHAQLEGDVFSITLTLPDQQSPLL